MDGDSGDVTFCGILLLIILFILINIISSSRGESLVENVNSNVMKFTYFTMFYCAPNYVNMHRLACLVCVSIGCMCS